MIMSIILMFHGLRIKHGFPMLKSVMSSYDDGSYVKDGKTYPNVWEMHYRVGFAYNF